MSEPPYKHGDVAGWATVDGDTLTIEALAVVVSCSLQYNGNYLVETNYGIDDVSPYGLGTHVVPVDIELMDQISEQGLPLAISEGYEQSPEVDQEPEMRDIEMGGEDLGYER